MILSYFAEASGPSVHISPLEIFTFRGYSITNSMIFAWVCSAIIIFAMTIVARKMTLRPKGGLFQFVEIGSDFITKVVTAGVSNKEKAMHYAPYFVTIFFFVALSNILGLLPGVGDALTYNGAPVFRPFTADLNGTFATAAISMIMIQYFAMKESGPIGHLRHYFAGKLWNPLTYLIGIYEIFNELVRVFSLGLRLFLNIAIGEIIISVFAFLGSFAAPITAFPFLLLELGVAILQAYIFVMLSVTYLSLAISHGHDESEILEKTAEPLKVSAI